MANLSLVVNSVDVTNLCWHKRITVDLSQDGYHADIYLDYSDGGSPPNAGDKFTLTLPNGDSFLLIAKTISKIEERYDDPSTPIWIHKFTCVDPLTYITNAKLPTRKPFVNSNTGTIIKTLLSSLDPTLDTSGVTDGTDVPSFNLRDFSSFGDVIRSEITSAGYVLRMGLGNAVIGKYDTAFSTTNNFRVDYNDSRYTPLRQDIEPPTDLLDSITVIPTKQVPIYRVWEYHVSDGRVMPSINLHAKPFGLEDAEPLKLSAGIDINDDTQFEVTGAVTTTSSHIELVSGTLTMLDARPFGFPFMLDFSNIRFLGSGSFTFGFTDDLGNWVYSVSSSDLSGAGISLITDTTNDQNTYSIYGSQETGTWAIWLRQRFNIPEEVIGSVQSVNSTAKTITFTTTPTTTGVDYIKVMSGTSATERGRASVTRRSQDSLTWTLDAIPPGTTAGDDIRRGVSADQTLTIKNLGVSIPSGYGLPTLQGVNTAIEQFIIQRTGQITGYLLSESNINPNSDYPRALSLDVDVTEHSDGQISGSGSSAVVTWARKFSTASRIDTSFSYVVGGKKQFDSVCGSDVNNHAVVNVDNEQDPAVLQSIADRICSLASRNYPRVQVPIESTEVTHTPLPWDLLPVVLPSQYRLPSGNIPIQQVGIKYLGGDQDDDILMFDINAGIKSAAERIKQDVLRGTGLTKYPIRIATISGVSAGGVTWNEQTGILTASISGASSVYGPRGETLNFGSGIRPAEVAGVADPAASPVTLRCIAPQAGRQPDILVFQVIYPPNGIDPSSVTTTIFTQARTAEFQWATASGALKYNIFRLKSGASGEADNNLELVDTVVYPGNTWRGPVSKTNKSIWVESQGLCDFTSSKVKATCSPSRLNAPELAFLKLDYDNTTKLVTSSPPSGATAIQFITAPTSGGWSISGGISVPSSGSPTAGLFHITILPLNTDASRPNFYGVPYDASQAGKDFYLTAAWLNLFDEPQDWCSPINPNFLKSAKPEKPATPTISDILVNEPNLETVEADANVSVRVWAREDKIHDFASANATGVKALLVRVRGKDRTPTATASNSGWTTPDNVFISDDNRAVAPSGNSTLSIGLKISGSLVGSKSITIGNGADQVYILGKAGDFWGSPISGFTNTPFNTDNAIQLVVTCGSAVATYNMPAFNVGPNNALHGFQVKLEASYRNSTVEVDYLVGRTFFSKDGQDFFERVGDGVFQVDSTEFVPSASAEGSLKFGSVWWLSNAINFHGKLKTASNDSTHDTVFIAGAQSTNLSAPTIVGYEKVDGDEQRIRIQVQFTQLDPPIPVSQLIIKRRKGNGRYKRIGDPLDLFGIDEYLASGTRNIFYDFQALDGVTDYNVVAILTGADGQQVQSAEYALSTNRKSSTTADVGPPMTPLITKAVWKKSRAALIVLKQPDVDTNVTTLYNYGISFYYPTGAIGGSRHYLDIDTGSDIVSPTFGPSGNAEFFTGGSSRFRGNALKADMPAAALTGGVGVIARAYNYVTGPSGVISSNSATGFPSITEIATITTISNDALTEDSGQASVPQNLVLIWGDKKGFKATWVKPATNNNSITGYYVVFSSTPAGGNYMDAETGAVATINTENGARVFTSDTRYVTHIKKSNVASAFSAGVYVKVWAQNIVTGVTTDGIAATGGPTLATSDVNDLAVAVWTDGGAAFTDPNVNNNFTGFNLTATKKAIRLKWSRPQGQLGFLTTTPTAISKFGVQVKGNLSGTDYWFNPDNPGSVNTTPVEFFVTSNEISYGHLRTQLSTQLQNSTGLVMAVRPYSIVSGTETSGTLSSFYPTSSPVAIPGDPIDSDTTVPPAATNAVIIPKQNVIRAKCILPTTQMNTHTKTEVVWRIKNNSNVVLGHLNDNSGTYVNSATEIRLDCGKSNDYTLNIKKADLTTLYPAGGVLEAYFYISNAIGSSTFSNVAPLSFGSIDTDALALDTAAPNSGGTLTAPAAKLNHKGLHITFALPTTQMNTHLYNVIILSDGAGNIFDPRSQTWVPSNPGYVGGPDAGTAEMKIGKSAHVNETVDYSTIFVGGRTSFLVSYGVRNNFNGGSTTYSATATVLASGSDKDPLASDTGPPGTGTLNGATLRFKVKAGLVIKFDLPTINMNTHKYNTLLITNNANGFVLDPALGTWGTDTTGGAGFQIGKGGHVVIPIKKADLFTNQSATIVSVVYKVWNDDGTGTAQSRASGPSTINVSGVVDVFNVNDAISVIDVSVSMQSGLQLLRNADYLEYRDTTATNILGSWSKADVGSVTVIDDIRGAGTGVRWIDTQHCVQIGSTNKYLISRDTVSGGFIPIQYTMPGDYFSVSMMVQDPTGGAGNGTITAFVYDVAGTNYTLTPAVIPISIQLTQTNYVMFGGVLQLSSATSVNPKYLVLQFTGFAGLNGGFTTVVKVDRVMLVRGKQPMAFTSSPKHETISIGNPPNQIISPDMNLPPSAGTQGGWYGPGNGGTFLS